jgi:hypothetical protein
MTNGSDKSKSGIVIANALIYLCGILLIGSAIAKVAHLPQVLQQFRAIGYEGSRLTFIAALEGVSASLFLIPRARSLGLLLVSAYLGGAIAVHLAYGQQLAALRPAIFLGTLWLGAWLRHPEILWSFRNTEAKRGQPAGSSASRESA